MIDLLLWVHVFVKTLNLDISRCHLASRIRTINRRPRLANTMFIRSTWDVKEPTHYSKRVGHEVPGVVAVLCESIAGPHQLKAAKTQPAQSNKQTTTTTTDYVREFY